MYASCTLRILTLCILTLFPISTFGEIPSEAEEYKHLFTRIMLEEFGLNAPITRLAAQVHQESKWKRYAKSPYAKGLGQFTTNTGKWITEKYNLNTFDPYSPKWSFRALAKYDKELLLQAPYKEQCLKWWYALRAYNGGRKWLLRESQIAKSDQPKDMISVCSDTGRSKKNCKQNIEYPEKILFKWEPIYKEGNWIGTELCQKTW